MTRDYTHCMDWMTASIEKAKKDMSRNHVTAFVEKCRVFNQLQTKSGGFLEYEKGNPPFSARTFLFLRRMFWGDYNYIHYRALPMNISNGCSYGGISITIVPISL